MASFRQLTVVSKEELRRLRDKQIKDYNPQIRSHAKLEDQIDDILNQPDLADDQKLALLQHVRTRISELQNVPEQTPAATKPDLPKPVEEKQQTWKSLVSYLPAQLQNKAGRLLEYINAQAGDFKFNDKYELVHNGQPIKGTNAIDLVSNLYTQRRAEPAGWPMFLDTLTKINVPHNLIGNRRAVDHIASSSALSSSEFASSAPLTHPVSEFTSPAPSRSASPDPKRRKSKIPVSIQSGHGIKVLKLYKI